MFIGLRPRRASLAVTGWLVVALLGAMLTSLPVRADEIDDLRREVDQLKQQVLFLQNQLPSGGAPASGGGSAAQQEVRWQELDRQLSELTGQIERVEIKVNDLAAQMERMQKDVEFRLSAIESGGAATGSVPVASASTGASQPMAGAQAGQPTELSSAASSAVAGGTAPSEPTATSSVQPSTGAASGQTGVLGTLTAEQAANLPQAPAGAAEAAAAAAGASNPDTASTQAQQSSGTFAPISLPGETPREKYDFATNLLQQGNYDKAEAALKTFVMQYPNDTLAGNAQYWLGETYYVRGDFRNAAVAFAEGYQKYPQSAKAPDNLLKLAMSLGQQGQTQNACVALRQLDKKFPEAPANIKDRALRAKERYSCN
jgi:tol-pal system protein YbgF